MSAYILIFQMEKNETLNTYKPEVALRSENIRIQIAIVLLIMLASYTYSNSESFKISQ